MQNRLAAVKEQQSTLQGQVEELKAAVEIEKMSRQESVSVGKTQLSQRPTQIASQDARATQLEELSALKKEYAQLETELAAYGACDPAKIEEKKRAVILAKEAAARWTGERRT